MRNPENEMTCPDCGATHHAYPRRRCVACHTEHEAGRAEHRQAFREDR